MQNLFFLYFNVEFIININQKNLLEFIKPHQMLINVIFLSFVQRNISQENPKFET